MRYEWGAFGDLYGEWESALRYYFAFLVCQVRGHIWSKPKYDIKMQGCKRCTHSRWEWRPPQPRSCRYEWD